MILVAVDPSVRSTGLAIFLDGRLTYATSVRRASSGEGPAERSLAMARLVADRVLYERNLAYSPPYDSAPPIHVVTEWPQIYRAQRAIGDPNDLPAIAAVGTAVAALLDAEEVRSYTPREWAGQVPKVTSGNCKASPRARRIRSRLSGDEVSVWEGLRTGDHDAVDAIGIGCHALGRSSATAGTTDRPSRSRA